MPAMSSAALVSAILDAVRESQCSGSLLSSKTVQPRRFNITDSAGGQFFLNTYIWTLTFGGRKALPNEYRIQMTGVESPLDVAVEPERTVLLGYEPGLNLFAGFDLERHRTFTTGSPSVQVDIEKLKEAETNGLVFHRKTNDEIVVGIRPDQLVAYCLNATKLHRYGRSAAVLNLLTKATVGQALDPAAVAALPAARQRMLATVTRLVRAADFNRRVLFAYGNRCAVTRTQLKLIDAAHILPVGATGSVDLTPNGIALAPTYHRAFDHGLIYLTDEYEMRLNPNRVAVLNGLNLVGGLEEFKAPLGKIFLPPDPAQRPAADYIHRANKYRKIV